MSKDTVLSLLRTLLTVAGSYILAHNLFGPVVNQDGITQAGGAIIALVGAVWGYFDKSTSIEGLQSAVRSVFQIVGGFLVASGKLSGQSLDTILGFITSLGPVLQSYTSRLKVKQLDQGKIVTHASGKVQLATPPIK